jgi:hypothetical protein
MDSCVFCGRDVGEVEGYICSECMNFVCEECIDIGVCKDCPALIQMEYEMEDKVVGCIICGKIVNEGFVCNICCNGICKRCLKYFGYIVCEDCLKSENKSGDKDGLIL